MDLIVEHDDAWLPLFGMDHEPDDHRKVPSTDVLEAYFHAFQRQGAIAGLLLAPENDIVAAASVHVLPQRSGDDVLRRFRRHPLVVSDTTTSDQPTPLGLARRAQHDRLLELPEGPDDQPRVVLWRHLVWIWDVRTTAASVLVTLSSECPSPHPAVDVVPLVDDLALGLRRGAD